MFSKSLPDGYGRIVFANGDIFTGYFQNGKFDGFGQYKFSNHTIVKGKWLNGLLEYSLLGKHIHDFDHIK